MRVSIIQLSATNNKTANLKAAEDLIISAVTNDQSDMVILPETFNYRGGSIDEKKACAETLNSSSKTYNLLQSLANKYKVFIHGGSICERDGENFYNTTLVFNNQGQEIARYRKIHLFDAIFAEGTEYKESDLITPGKAIVTYTANNITIGCTICYDLRFAELYQALTAKGAVMITVPSAFTSYTGEAHWEILLRARAIETQCYIAAPNQVGCFEEDGCVKSNWGHSMIIDPWGKILVEIAEETGYATTELNFDYLKAIRSKLPVRHHKRGDIFNNSD